MSRKSHAENENTLQGLVGKRVALDLKDRAETTFSPVVLTEVSPLGATVTWQSRGKDNVVFVPLANISHISSQAKGDGAGSEEDEGNGEE